MIVLRSQETAQTFKFIPRSMGADTFILTNETTNISTTYNVTTNQADYYSEVSVILDLVDGEFYKFQALAGAVIVYTDKIFCTNQVIEDYTINKDKYTETTTTNDYIIL